MTTEHLQRAQRHIERAQAIYAFGANEKRKRGEEPQPQIPIINILSVHIDYTPTQVDAQRIQELQRRQEPEVLLVRRDIVWNDATDPVTEERRVQARRRAGFQDSIQRRFRGDSRIHFDEQFLISLDYHHQEDNEDARVVFRLAYTGELNEDQERIHEALTDAYHRAKFLSSEEVNFTSNFYQEH